ncbi:beta-L-arabinofuranosidase domain-containing protein [Isoptericola sp. NPDC057559]|uniref:beta-L-arabinofuranosidase domain-containing protein n=1 Tax=Isoptericola sp. NPDC057559 TaxID=3346168 RepID=UPI00367F898D
MNTPATPSGTTPSGTTSRAPAGRELPLGAITPRGWLRDQLRLQADGLTGQLEKIWPDVGPTNAWRGGVDGEDWERGPYYLDGLLPLAHVLEDEGLLAQVQPWVEAILASQREDGFFGPATNDDWWPRMVALKVLTQHADATGDERVVPFLQRYFRHQLEQLPGRPLRSWGRARGADNALSVWWLHHRTGEEWLLDLVDVLDAQTIRWDDYLGGDLITGAARVFSHRIHGPNVAMGLKKGAVDWVRDGDDTHRAATERSFANLDRWHGQAHGWFSGDEWLGGPEAAAGIETCQVVEMMFTCGVLAATFGDGVHGDRLESLAFNLLPASCDPRMLAHQYHQQATQLEVSVARRDWSFSSDDANLFGLEPHFGCCTANFHQGWPKFVRNLWMRADDGGLRAVAYAPAVVRTDVGGDPVEVTVRTAYPFEETIAVDVVTDRAEPFDLQLRVPGWASSFELTVDGEAVDAEPVDGYVTLRRSWADAADVRLVLPMAPRVVRRARQAAAVFLGPLSMVHPLGENWVEVPGAPGLGEWEVHRRTSWNKALADVAHAASWEVERAPVREVPWGLGGPRPGEGSPVKVHAPGARATEWRAQGVDAPPPPPSPLLERGAGDDVTLVPYGLARLRVAEFPVVGSWADRDDPDDPQYA